jgi:two-component system sensor histidine kinase UhpB
VSTGTLNGDRAPLAGPLGWPAVVGTDGQTVHSAAPTKETSTRKRRPLLQKLFIANAVVLVVAALLLILTPVTISAPVTLGELALIVGAVVAMLTATLLLLRRALLPLEQLTALMGRIDPLDPGRRLTGVDHADAEVATLIEAFNSMLDRLEQERRGSARRALAAQEEERLRIARELHDGIGQTLTAVAMQAERAAHSPDDARQAALLEIPESIRHSIDDVRRIARELRPEALDDLGLTNALLTLCRRMAHQSGIRIQPELDVSRGMPELLPETELVIYRVAQEGLTNAIRHAEATQITVALQVAEDRLTLCVRDDGGGIDRPLPGDTAGISGMRERALLVGAQLSIRSNPGAGTEVRLDVPFDEEHRAYPAEDQDPDRR